MSKHNYDKVIIIYKGYKIEYGESRFDDSKSAWKLLDSEDSLAYKNELLSKVKEYVDRLVKNEFKPFQAYYQGWSNEDYSLVTVTCIDDKGGYWIKDSKGKRTKVRGEQLIHKTTINEGLFKELNQALRDLKAQEAKIKEINLLFRRCENLDKDDE